MLETRAIIVETHQSRALVQANQGNGCDQCKGKGCGTGKLSQLFCSKPRLFQVDNRINAAVGDEVIISVADGAVLRGISLVYLLPLFLLVGGAMLGSSLASPAGPSDAYSAAGAISGLVAGFVLARWISSRYARSRFEPFVARLWRE